MTRQMVGSRTHIALALVLGVAGCGPQPTVILNERADRSANTLGLDSRDFEDAAASLVQDMIKSGRMNKPGGGRYVVGISRITNDTMQRIDTDQLVKKIRIELNNSGKAIISTGFGLSGPEDPMIEMVRQARASSETKQSTLPGIGEKIAPELSLTGKLIQQNNRIDGGAQRVDYYFQLSVSEIRSGLAFWEGEKRIAKLGANGTVPW